jgi:hypothetical protein
VAVQVVEAVVLVELELLQVVELVVLVEVQVLIQFQAQQFLMLQVELVEINLAQLREQQHQPILAQAEAEDKVTQRLLQVAQVAQA